MMRWRIFPTLSVLLFLPLWISAQLQTPDEFLGYRLGSKYTPHYKIVQYVQALAQASPGRLKTQVYGQTYEGRPLMLAFISTEENIRNLDAIRKNSLRLAGLLRDSQQPDESMPVLVWLSYNVHGNEPASSEAAMKTMHTLLDPNGKGGGWLKNTVVIIDPCLNPDGRDRYANWQNGVTGLVPDPNPQSREHREPWPGGRTNHYYFDLNRDWAWQTQVESRQRMKVYNEWMPQVHVDFHEQGFNEPYYFAPAAEPYHEVITPWQREFQKMIGKNNAKYFDEQGWLYFTKERFDLFYPSYGDTYPTYNGAIGMTFEQGGIRGALAVELEDGDTLTLAARIAHHYTTGLSTIEVSSVNASRLVKEFRKFFADAASGTGLEYKYYVIRNRPSMGQDGGTMGAYLRQNNLEYGFAPSKTQAKGFNYRTGKEETFTINQHDLVIPAQQARSAMVKVLFEPRNKLSDSATYDITAWSLPYAMGMEAYAVKDKLTMPGLVSQLPPPGAGQTVTTVPANAYAYLIPWTDFGSAILLGQLLQAGVKVRYAEQPFEVNGRTFEKGSLIVTRAANEAQGDKLYSLISKAIANTPGYHESVVPIQTGYVDKGFDLGSDRVRYIRKPRVAILAGEQTSSNAAGEIWHYFEQQLKYPVSVIQPNDLGQLNWKSFDVMVMPDGFYRFLGEKNTVEDLRNWIQQGGRLIAMENAVAQLAGLEWSLKRKKEEGKKDGDKEPEEPLLKYEDREKEYLKSSIPGAVYRVDLDPSHPLAFGYGSQFYTLKQDANLYEFIRDGGWNVGVIRKDSYVTGFAGVKTKEKLKDGLILGVQDIGRGHVVYFVDDPIFRGFWESGKLLLANAVFLVGQ
ncbi:MAG: M14 family metallopeptidase [Chitinophagaceae bacterium]|nr:M14 family metallopeptidase [Chitinophagaceae bacterium]